ncbi:hypothetical protein GALMADRAFT_256029 [Galerina marginata CBS 339.88]|uniref:F-box domain-containing protein n=1 Tax=Galerina marginata (strain CBS 339.88) TaxID=685588 RepID=A0A067SN95_GALM3|nr:hypothetical protein GALMADRAFT_256029 [Galerina marginata CBS 339.88]
MASLSTLPVELHTSILKYLLSLSRQPAPPSAETRSLYISMGFTPPPDPIPPILEWIADDGSPISSFPFNAASVCKLWRDILGQIPECWTRVTFDLAMDPTPFLDTFSWSSDQDKIEVTVFNSAVRPDEVDKEHETRYALIVAHALQPHIHRCKSITFTTVFSSSLPSPTIFFVQNAPHIEALNLHCHIDDIDIPDLLHVYPASEDELLQLATSFPELRKLSMPGFWFMNTMLRCRNTRWPNQVQFGRFPTVDIFQFKFPVNGVYSLQNFVSYISQMCGLFHFRDLSLAYECDNPRPMDPRQYRIYGDFHFQSVSKGFLTHLYSIADISADEFVTFERCEIPNIKQHQNGDYLTLVDIIDNDGGHSLRNILGAWSGSELTIRSCPSFNDSTISWLGSEVQYAPYDADVDETKDPSDAVLHYHLRFLDSSQPFTTFPAERMTLISIQDCSNFTPRILRDVIQHRTTVVDAEVATGQQKLSVEALFVTGRGPILTPDDRIWFEECAAKLLVTWTTRNDEGISEVFSTRPSVE